MLKEKVSVENNLIENVESRIEAMDKNIGSYKDLFLDDNKRYSRKKANKFLLPDTCKSFLSFLVV
jgi:hypothetical protein